MPALDLTVYVYVLGTVLEGPTDNSVVLLLLCETCNVFHQNASCHRAAGDCLQPYLVSKVRN